MTVTGARLQGNELILTLRNPLEAAREVYRFRAGEYELTRARKKRSLDANAYCWVLINAIAQKIHEPPVEVYRRYIRDVGCRTSVVCVRVEDAEAEIQSFLQGHIGRMADIGESKLPGCVTIHKKYGSSSYDSRQMAAFIDSIVQDCLALDIETRPREEIESLVSQWGGTHG